MNILNRLFGKKRGDAVLEMEKSGVNFDLYVILRKVRDQGADDTDIRTWWNMPDEQHESLKQEDDLHRVAAFKSLLDMGETKKHAVEKLRKGYPIYEMYKPDGPHYDQDDPLPYELKARVNKYFGNLSLDELKQLKVDTEKYSSMNAYIREKMSNGEIPSL